MLLGTVPVEEDGSAYFRAPARKPLYFQAVDQTGRAIQSMRSVTYLQPGERRSCVGCHEGPNVIPPAGIPLATRRPASVLKPGPEGSLPMSFPLLVQPALDRNCVNCHTTFTGEKRGEFSAAYESLRKFVRWYEWGDKSITQIATHPRRIGADESPLTRILEDATHRKLKLPEEDLRRIYLWLDANAPFYCRYDKPARLAQQAGKAVLLPQDQ